jgi:hypothetical protein
VLLVDVWLLSFASLRRAAAAAAAAASSCALAVALLAAAAVDFAAPRRHAYGMGTRDEVCMVDQQARIRSDA